jgi:hypothetical protein
LTDQEAEMHRSTVPSAPRTSSIAIAVLALALVTLAIALGNANDIIAGITYTGGT